ncbi:hypothetical protein OSTOST_09173, partial [Ostertagia ostertagi]
GFFLLLVNEFARVSAADKCPNGFQFVTETSYCYQISSKLYSAADAGSYCGTQGAQLASLVLQAEMTALLSEPSIYGDCATLRAGSSPGMASCPCYNQQPALCKMKPKLCNDGNFGGPNIRSGTITSPGFPTQYYNNLDCYYQIEGKFDILIIAE